MRGTLATSQRHFVLHLHPHLHHSFDVRHRLRTADRDCSPGTVNLPAKSSDADDCLFRLRWEKRGPLIAAVLELTTQTPEIAEKKQVPTSLQHLGDETAFSWYTKLSVVIHLRRTTSVSSRPIACKEIANSSDTWQWEYQEELLTKCGLHIDPISCGYSPRSITFVIRSQNISVMLRSKH